MAIRLCHSTTFVRAITNGPIPLFLGRDREKIAPQVKFVDIMMTAPFPVGFFAYQRDTSAEACFQVTIPAETVAFFNVGHIAPTPCEDIVKFFNVGVSVESSCVEASGTVLFFNVSEQEIPDCETNTIKFFNVANIEEVL